MIPDEARRPLAVAAPSAVRVLEYLVRQDVADEAAIAESLALGTADLRAALETLERDRLVVRVPTGRAGAQRDPWGGGGLWTALPPRSVLTTVLAQRRQELAVWEQHADDLETAYREFVGDPDQGSDVDVVTGARQVGTVYEHLLETATHEVLHLARPPYLPLTLDLLGRPDRPVTGAPVEMRSVYASSMFTEPASLEMALGARARGRRVRLAQRVPIKLVLVDRTIAMLPAGGDDAGDASLVVHSPAIVGALWALFERIWDSAVPLARWVSDDGEPPSERPRADEGGPGDGPPTWSRAKPRVGERARSILRLMADGLTDEAIGKTLDISRRTVQAEVTALAEQLGARTRFQIALLAAEQGLV